MRSSHQRETTTPMKIPVFEQWMGSYLSEIILRTILASHLMRMFTKKYFSKVEGLLAINSSFTARLWIAVSINKVSSNAYKD